MTITSMRVARPGTPLGSPTEWVDITASIASFQLGFARTAAAMDELHRAATKASQTLMLTFPLTKSEHRRMETLRARMNRRPALIHNGRKPR